MSKIEMHTSNKIAAKHVKLIARERIINPSTGRVHDDIGLRALNGYYESPFVEFDSNEDEDEIFKTLVLRFKSEYESLRNPEITIKYSDESC